MVEDGAMKFAPTLLALLVCAAPASAAEMKIATWSMGWLTERPAGDPAVPEDVARKSAEDLDRLRAYAEKLDADVIALQGIDGPEIAARVFPPDRYDVVLTRDDTALRTGFAIRKGLAHADHGDAGALGLDPRSRLRSGADVSVGALRLLSVHLKSGCRDGPLDGPRPQCATLSAQLGALKDWIAARAAEGAPFVVAGNFNRWMDGADPFLAALQAAAPLARATEGRSDPCWGGAPFADHILAGGAARNWIAPDSMRVLIYKEVGPEWRKRLSDHCPLSIRLRLPDDAPGR